MASDSFFNYPGDTHGPAPVRDPIVFLPDLDERDWTTLIGYMQVLRFAQGDTVLPVGAVDRALYVVADGVLELANPEGPARVETGALIGEMPFFDARPHNVAVRALTDVDLLGLSPEAFEVLAAREPLLARTVLLDLGRILSLRLRRALVESTVVDRRST